MITLRDAAQKLEIEMEGPKSGVQTSSFKVLTGVLVGGGGLSAISPEHMTRVSDFLSGLPAGAYGVVVAYIVYRMVVEAAFVFSARKTEISTEEK